MSSIDFLKTVRKGQVWVHSTLGKVKVLGVAKDLQGGTSLMLQRINPPVEVASGKVLEQFSTGILRLYEAQPRVTPATRSLILD